MDMDAGPGSKSGLGINGSAMNNNDAAAYPAGQQSLPANKQPFCYDGRLSAAASSRRML